MVIKKYIVNNMNEAMTRIRYELGKDAVIISQRKIRKPGFSGLFSKKVLEVTVAVEKNREPEDYKNTVSKKETDNSDRFDMKDRIDIKDRIDMKDSLDAIKRLVKQNDFTNDSDKFNSANSNDKYDTVNLNQEYVNKINKYNKGNAIENIEDMKENKIVKEDNKEISFIYKEMLEMKSMIENISNGSSKEKNKSDLEILLHYNDVKNELVNRIMEDMNKQVDISNEKEQVIESEQEFKTYNEKENLESVLKNYIHISDVEMKGNVVLVGPTGVGKTTTLAKLAGRLALIEKKKVGLITIDTYRIGAVDQLRTYAEIMNIPFKVVFTIKEMSSALLEMKDCDVVLIDTTGRSSKNTMQLSELRAFVNKVQTSNIHLVISSTTKNRDLETIIDGYRELNFENIIITKLDETTTYGSILNIIDYAKKPISFITTGQNVPDDIKRLEPKELIKLILGDEIL